MKRSIVLVGLVLLFVSQRESLGQTWGDLSVTFALDSAPDAAKAIDANKDTNVCGVKSKLFDESLVVNPQNKGIANIVVFLYVAPGASKPKVHPDYEKTSKDKITLDNNACRFDPHICVLRTTQTLVVSNSDAVGHNTKVDLLANTPINPIIPANAKLEQQFRVEERLPAPVSCSIHPWMTARLVVKDHPYVAVSDADGKLVIRNIPAGIHKFQVWHEKIGFVTAKPDWSKGRFDYTIKAGTNDLGTVVVKKDLFK